MNFDLTEEQRMIRDTAREFAGKEVKPAGNFRFMPKPDRCFRRVPVWPPRPNRGDRDFFKSLN